MNLLDWNVFLQSPKVSPGPVALSIGVFDGLHRGHQVLIREICAQVDLCPWVITFHPHPVRVLRPQEYPGDIMTKGQKVHGLTALGLDTTVMIDSYRFVVSQKHL